MDLIRLFDSVDALFGTHMLIDWTLLVAQVAILTALVWRGFRTRPKANLYLVVIASTLLVLVQGQALWMFGTFNGHSYWFHLYQLITPDGARLANAYMALFTCALVIGYRVGARPSGHLAKAAPREMPVPYWLGTSWLAVWIGLLLSTTGGVLEAIQHPGQLIAGQTAALIGVSMGKFPLLDALVHGRRPGPIAFGAYAVTVALTLLNSRFLTIFLIIQAGMALQYCGKTLAVRWIVIVMILSALVLIPFGLYRDFTTVLPGADPTRLSDWAEFVRVRTGGGVVDWFYRFNVEGFSGLAGILSYDILSSGIRHDFGISSLGFVTQLIPNGLRNDPSLPFAGVSDFFAGASPYHGSVVSPGPELAFAHYGLPGLVLLGWLLGWLASWLHARMVNPMGDRLLIAVLSVQVMQMIRGTFATVIFFGLGDIAMLLVYRAMARVEASAAAGLPGYKVRLPASGLD